MKYVTIDQYRNSGDFPLTNQHTDLILANMITRAEAAIDAYMDFDERLGGFEAHTAWVEFAWDGESRRVRMPNLPVPVRQALRYRIQVSTQTADNSPFVATINTGDVAYQVQEGYIEIVPLQSITYALTPVLVQLGLNPPIVQLDYEAGYFFPIWGERLISARNNQTYYASRGFWATEYTQALSIQPMTRPAIPPVVYVNGIVTTDAYTYDPVEGIVTFPPVSGVPVRTGTDIVSADYCFTIPERVRASCIDQITYLLGQQALNQLGLSGLDSVRNGDQQLKRQVGEVAGLCANAARKLQGFKVIGIG